ncbi:MAG: AAA family ATPase [Planctomycetota bacterium]
MYESFYQLALLPFESTPDPRFFYASEQHREALAAIEYTIRMRKGIVLVTGQIGSGKTTVGRTMIAGCADSARIVQLPHGHRDGESLIRSLLRSMRVKDRTTDDHAARLERLQRRLIRSADQGYPVVVFIDEAQTLSNAALEELRLLSNFDQNARKLLQLVLVGQPELRTRIGSPELSALRQRIVLAKRLAPLGVGDAKGYVAHRLRVASLDPDRPGVSFDDDAVARIHAFAGGAPRLINVVCDNCLLMGFVREVRRIGVDIVERSIRDMVAMLSTDGLDAGFQPIDTRERALSMAG